MRTPVRVLARATLTAQLGSAVTGAIVRLTSSGLGCPDWPRCAADTLVLGADTGWHQGVEFGNRALALAVGIVSLATFALAWRTRARRLLPWAGIQVAGVPAQAALGGATVLSDLDPLLVAAGVVLLGTVTVCAGPHPGSPGTRRLPLNLGAGLLVAALTRLHHAKVGVA